MPEKYPVSKSSIANIIISNLTNLMRGNLAALLKRLVLSPTPIHRIDEW